MNLTASEIFTIGFLGGLGYYTAAFVYGVVDAILVAFIKLVFGE